jgi:hypothetical protein
MAQQFLNGSGVIAGIDKMGGKRVPEGMTTNVFRNRGLFGGLFYRSLNRDLVDMVSTNDPRPWIQRSFAGREDELPCPATIGIGIFSNQGVGQIDTTVIRGNVDSPDP